MPQQLLTIEGKTQFDSFIHTGLFDVYHPSAHDFTPFMATPLPVVMAHCHITTIAQKWV